MGETKGTVPALNLEESIKSCGPWSRQSHSTRGFLVSFLSEDANLKNPRISDVSELQHLMRLSVSIG